jgi:hypothetical protein
VTAVKTRLNGAQPRRNKMTTITTKNSPIMYFKDWRTEESMLFTRTKSGEMAGATCE